MNNIQKAFKNKAKCGLRMARGGFLDNIQPASPTSMFTPSPSGNANQGADLFGAGPGSPLPTAGVRQPVQQPGLRQPSLLEKLNSGIAINNGIANSNMTMSEKAALGLGTTSADASLMNRQTDAMTSLRAGLAQQGGQNMADGGILARLGGRGAQIDAAVNSAVGDNAPAPAAPAVEVDAPDERGVRPSERAAARAQIDASKPKGFVAGLRSKLGFAEGGIVRGKGTTTSDSVPMNVSGNEVNLSNKEAVLPAKTVQALGGPEEVEELIERTNGKPPVKHGLRAGGSYEGGAVETATHWPNGQPKLAPTGESMRPAPTAQEVYGTGPGNLLTAAERNVKGIGGAAAWGLGNAMTVPATATDVVKNTGAALLGQTRDDPNGDVNAARSFAAEGEQAVRDNFAPVVAQIKQSTGLRSAPLPSASQDAANPAIPQMSVAPNRLVQAAQAEAVQNEGLRARAMGPLADVPDDIKTTTSGGGRSLAFNSKNDAAAETIGNYWQGKQGVRQADGEGIVSMRQKDGSYKNVILGKSEYTGADGKPTSNWSDTKAFKDSETRNAKLAGLARSMERDRYTRDTQADIKDPRVIAAAQQNLARMSGEDAAAAHTADQVAERGLRARQLDIQSKGVDAAIENNHIVRQMQVNAANKAEANDRLEHANSLVEQSGYDKNELPAFKRFVAEAHLAGERQKDGSFKPMDNFETLTKAQQQKMMPGIQAEYEMMKRAYAHRVNSGSVGPFIPKPNSELKPGEDKFGWSDIDVNETTGLPKLWGDGSENNNGIREYLDMKLVPRILGGRSDTMVVAKNGMRVRQGAMDQEIRDPRGNVLRGRADVRGLRRDQQN